MFLQMLIICPLVFLAGFIDAIAGGGGLISLPAYMIAGLPVHNAIGTNKLSSSMGTSLATWKYWRSGFIPLKPLPLCVVCAFLGSSSGAKLALHISDHYFKLLMLIIIPITAIYVMKKKDFSEQKEPYSERKTILFCGLIALVIGVYDGFYGPGTGTFLLLLLTGVAHIEMTKANGITKSINLMTNYAALAVYITSGKTLLLIGFVAGLFNIAGNYLGAVYFQKNGARSVKLPMIAVLVIFFIKIISEII